MEHPRADLWWLAAPAAIWIGHFVTVYAVVAVWCARFAQADGRLGPVGPAFAGITVLALALLGGITVRSVRRYALVPPETPDADSDLARHRFLALATLLLAALAILGIGLVSISFTVVGSCR